MKTKRDFLSNYTVRINIYEEFRGSGILVPVNNDTYYVVTAKHNFDKDINDPFSPSVLDTSDYQNIRIENDSKNEVCKVSKLVYQKGDLIIFHVKNIADSINDLDSIYVLKDEPSDDIEHFFRGYPNGKVDLMDGLYSRNFDPNDPELFTFKNQHQIDASNLKGYSGSGVFIKERATFYLVGVLLETRDGIYHYTCYDLSKVIDEINSKISPRIKTQNNILDITTTEKMYTQMINRNKGSFLAIKAKKIFNTKNHVYKDLGDREKLEKLANYIKNTNKFDELEQEYQKKLADLYLLGAFISQEYGFKKEVKKYFDKARIYDSKYIRYKSNLEGIDALETLKKGKLAYVDKNFDKAKEYLEEALYTDAKKNRIEIYELLVKLEKDNQKLIENYEELEKLYKENTIQKAEALYQLSILYEDRESKIKKCKEALDIIEGNDNPLNNELKYKIHKQANQVLEVNPPYKNLRSMLEKLVDIDSKYQAELDAVTSLEYEEKENSRLYSELKEVSEIHEFVKLDSSLKTNYIEALKNKLNKEEQKSRKIWIDNLNLKEENQIINRVAKLAVIPILFGILIAKYGEFTLFGLSF